VEWRHTIRGNRVTDCSYVGIQLENAFNSVVENNLITNAQAAGIIVINYASDIGCKAGGELNQFGDTKGTGDCRGLNLNTNVQQNIIINSGDVGGIVSYDSSGVNVYQNLVYGSNVALYVTNIAKFSKNWDVRNNIFANNSRTGLSIADPASLSWENNNLFYHPANKNVFEVRYPASTFYPFAEWQKKYKLGQNSIEADPLFINPDSFDFHLKPQSPALGAGVNLNISTDFDGHPRSAGSAVDIGPYQLSSQH
jgi:parallel beta-helix repeat protein